MAMIELDHTSSGAQICAALVRDDEFAALVNLKAGRKKADLYAAVASEANAEFAALGSSAEPLNRSDVKTAVIAAIYGGTHITASDSLTAATGLKQSENKAEHSAFWKAIKSKMKPVMAVESYIKALVEAVSESHDSFELPLASGGSVTFYPKAKETVKKKCLHRSNFLTGEKLNSKWEVEEPAEAKVAVKSVTASYVQGYDALILAKVQARLVDAGIPFLAKHDAYLVDEADAEALMTIVKDVMVELFSGYPLNDLKEALEAKYEMELPAFEAYGSFDPASILDSNFVIAE